MSETAMADALVDHFQRTWGMLRRATENFPEEAWTDGGKARMSPARIGYHLLMAAERYCWQGPVDEFMAKREFGLNWLTTPLEELPARSQLLKHLQTMEAKVIGWLREHGDTGLIGRKPAFAWTGDCALGQALYLLRHQMYHAAELNAELRRRGVPTADWQ